MAQDWEFLPSQKPGETQRKPLPPSGDAWDILSDQKLKGSKGAAVRTDKSCAWARTQPSVEQIRGALAICLDADTTHFLL
jgi:hypothetical protein